MCYKDRAAKADLKQGNLSRALLCSACLLSKEPDWSAQGCISYTSQRTSTLLQAGLQRSYNLAEAVHDVSESLRSIARPNCRSQISSSGIRKCRPCQGSGCVQNLL